jgi:acetolactate decarboxylase
MGMTLVMCVPLWAQNGPVHATGAMRNTMFNGQLAGLIDLDSLAVPGTFGIGPLEYLRGEVLVLDGNVYISTVDDPGSMLVVKDEAAKAPFFVHQRVKEWQEVQLPDSVADLAGLDRFLADRYADLKVLSSTWRSTSWMSPRGPGSPDRMMRIATTSISR